MTRILALLSLATAALISSSCDGHTWKETQVLHEKYGGHGEAKDAHAAPAAGHEAKPDAHGAEAKKH